MSIVNNMDFNTLLHEKAELINHTLAQLLASQQIDSKLKESLKYTLGTPGKRVRSALVLWCCELAGGQVNRNAEIAAAAIEMVHTYSLVHDDLPAMDDDDLRRGLPTCHKAFDEATAILTGDALLTLAFEILAKEIDEPTIAVKLIAQLAQDAGPSGMIAGQMADIKTSMLDTGCSSSIQNRVSRIEYIHTNKTAKMFRCAAAMGAICGGASKQQIDQLSEYGLKIGLGFQIADDILDVSASSEQLGKTAGKDAKAAKCTYPAVVGIDKARELEKKLADEAVAVLRPLGKKADTLRQLAMAMLERTK
ncbi:MAG: polyprenyl synthetase family protein [Planctomycetes bacterium]|nr:polyprenyl synthetase family protein [Planctomycetota bacterium]